MIYDNIFMKEVNLSLLGHFKTTLFDDVYNFDIIVWYLVTHFVVYCSDIQPVTVRF